MADVGKICWPTNYFFRMAIYLTVFSHTDKENPLMSLVEQINALREQVVASEKAQVEAVVSSLEETKAALSAQVSELQFKLEEALAGAITQDVQDALDALKADIEAIYVEEAPTPEPAPEF